MASGWTNKGKYKLLGWGFRGASAPTDYKMALVTNAVTPVADTNTLSELTEIATGTGYTSGGLTVERSATGFDVWTEDDANDRAYVQIKDLVWTASGAGMSNIYYSVLTDDNVTIGNREIYAYFDLTGPLTVSSGQTLTLQDFELRLTE
jgi:hypothetical protein